MRPAPCLALLVLLACLAPAGCGDGTAESSRDPGPEVWSLGPSPLLTIGAIDGDPAYVLSDVRDVGLFPDGRVVVADGGTQTLRLYDGDGAFLRRMGGAGVGPGEFAYLSGVGIAAPDTILAYDSRGLRLTRFLADGEPLSTLSLQAEDGFPELYIGTRATGDHAVAWIRQAPRDPTVPTADPMQVAWFGSDGAMRELVTTFPGMRRLGSPVPFSPHFHAAMIGDSLFLADGTEAAVHVLGPTGDGGRILRIPMEGWSAPDAWARLEDAIGDPDRIEELREVRESPGTDSIPYFSDLLADDAGRLWLKTYDPATDSHWLRQPRSRPRVGGEWLVLDPAAGVLARVAVPDHFRPMVVSSERVGGIALDPFGIERVEVYPVVREWP